MTHKTKFQALLLLSLSLMLFISLSPLYAQNPGSPTDNACNPGGQMEGKCDTAWEWQCGFYLARWFNAGGWGNPNNSIPDWCANLLPPRPVLAPDTPTTTTPPIKPPAPPR